MTYEDIKRINDTLPRLDIKGKPYAAVPARIAAFRQLCPNGSIQTEIINMSDGVVTMRTTVTDEDGRVLATGFAQEKEANGYINKTSFIENCETSAVGRALGMIGIGSEGSLASAEEMVNALANQQTAAEKIDNVMAAALLAKVEKMGLHIDSILDHYSLAELGDMTVSQYRDCVKKLGKGKS